MIPTLVMAGLLASGFAMAKEVRWVGEKVNSKNHSIVKVEADADEGVQIMVKADGSKKKYDFSFDELEQMDNVEARLGDLDDETREKVLHLLGQLSNHDAKVIELKDVDVKRGDQETEIFIVKTGNKEDMMHIEIDVEGDGVANAERFHVAKFIGEGHGPNKALHKRMKWKLENGEKPELAKVIKRLIKKSDLTQEQIEEIRAALDDK